MIANTIAMTRAVGRFDERFTPYPFKELREVLGCSKTADGVLSFDGPAALTSNPFAGIPAVQPVRRRAFVVPIVPVDRSVVKAQFGAPDLAHLRPAHERVCGAFAGPSRARLQLARQATRLIAWSALTTPAR
jgi:hypothetical protein